jgi:hypothetical protein
MSKGIGHEKSRSWSSNNCPRYNNMRTECFNHKSNCSGGTGYKQKSEMGSEITRIIKVKE